jgi:GNAT superfamily N-acetyltransferase
MRGEGSHPGKAPVAVRTASTADDWQAARRLIQAYADGLGVDLSFQGFEREVADLARIYGPPRGRLLLAWARAYERGAADADARKRAEPIGCVAIRPLGASAAELKRLYVEPRARGRDVGRTLTASAIEAARGIGYRVLKLDTLPSMRAAHALYASLGFAPTAPYTFNPVPGAEFLELALDRDDR